MNQWIRSASTPVQTKMDSELLNYISDVTAVKENYLNHSKNILMKNVSVKDQVVKEINRIKDNLLKRART
jgi:acyl-CoA thioesterase